MQIMINIDDMAYKFVQNTSFVEDESTLFKQTNADRQKTLFLFGILDAIKNGTTQPQKRTEERTETRACDCISREAAIQAVTHFDDTLKRLYELPSVEPERKLGHWEYIQYDGNPKIGNWHCSNCRLIVNFGFEGVPYYHYCPGCGAEMRDEQALKNADNETAFGGLQSAT